MKAQRDGAVARVSYDGRTFEYRGTAEITRAIAELENELQTLQGKAPVRQIRGLHFEGLLILNLLSRIAGAARLLATGELAQSPGFEGAQMERRLTAWRAGGESINRLILQGGELQRARTRQLVRTNPYTANAAASVTSHAVGCGIKPSSWVDDQALKDEIQRLWLAWTDEAAALMGLQPGTCSCCCRVVLAGKPLFRLKYALWHPRLFAKTMMYRT